MDATIKKHIKAWEKKPSLRFIYQEDIYKRIEKHMMRGPTLEAGSGPGFFKKYRPDIIASDILLLKDLDLVCNSHRVPFRDASLANIVGIDTLHHFERPGLFFDECQRILKPGGRLILVEPWVSFFSGLIYKYLHHEDCELVVDPLGEAFGKTKDPWQGNSMIAYQIFCKANLSKFSGRFRSLSVKVLKPFSYFAYLLTGGFQPLGIRSKRAISWLLKVDNLFEPVMTNVFSFRVLVVLEKNNPDVK